MTHGSVSGLPAWDDIAGAYKGSALLLGNGASLALSSKFRYDSLFEQAKLAGSLSPEDVSLFEELDADCNFEYVLRSLAVAEPVIKVLCRDAPSVRARYESVRDALFKAVNENHATHKDVKRHFQGLSDHLRATYHSVFTLSYDLILYWAMMWWIDQDKKAREHLFEDFYRGPKTPAFTPAPAVNNVEAHGATAVFYLHGGLHLYQPTGGFVSKRTSGIGANLLAQFGRSVDGEDVLPVFVSEGHADKKVRSIAHNTYLSFAYEQLRSCESPIVLFGAELNPRYDDHIICALARHKRRHIAISLYDVKSVNALKNRQDDYVARFRKHGIHEHWLRFYDASTHPLGQL